jgi:ABC-type Mn2+/Zn2+ transport system ATPase subunit
VTFAPVATPREGIEPLGKLAIETRGLKKRFGKTHAIAGVDLAVTAGGEYGMLGPNGAGKTTAIRMLSTLLHPEPERRKCSSPRGWPARP